MSPSLLRRSRAAADDNQCYTGCRWPRPAILGSNVRLRSKRHVLTRTPRGRRPDFKAVIIGGGVAGLEAMLEVVFPPSSRMAPFPAFRKSRSAPTGWLPVPAWQAPRSLGSRVGEPASLRSTSSVGCRVQTVSMQLVTRQASRSSKGASQPRRPMSRRDRSLCPREPTSRPVRFVPSCGRFLLSGAQPTFLRVELGGGHGETSTVSEEALWWPPGKIVGHYLSPFLASLGIAEVHDEDEDVLRVEIDAATAHELADS